MSTTLPLLGLACALALTGCSVEPPAHPPGAVIESLDIFMTRSSLTTTEFEQYSLAGGTLLSECGLVERGKFVAKTQNVGSIDSETAAAITGAAFAVHRTIAEKTPSFDPPGTKPTPFDPGAFKLKSNLNGGAIEVKTSFDSVVNGETKPAQDIAKLTKLVRLAASDGCGSRSFFGLMPLKR